MNKQTQTVNKSAYLIINAQIFPITKPIVKIGRNLENDLVIQDVLVSRNHAEIHFKDGNFHLKDLKSTGGTYLNNVKISEGRLFSNDLILIANTPMMFIIEEDQHIQKSLEKKTGTLELPEDDTEEEETNSTDVKPVQKTETLQFPIKPKPTEEEQN